MARRRSLLVELQREYARQHRAQELQASKAARQRAREEERRRRQAAREATADEKERQRLHREEQQAEAARRTAELTDRMAALGALLNRTLDVRMHIPFSQLKRAVDVPPFDPGALASPAPAPTWEQYEPPQPQGLKRLLTSRARLEQERAVAEEAFQRALAQHASAEQARLRRLAERRQEHAHAMGQAEEEVGEHNAEVDELEAGFHAGEPDHVERYVALALSASRYPAGWSLPLRVAYRPEPRELLVERELPPLSVVPHARGYRYVQTRDEVDVLPRRPSEVKACYASVVAQVALRTLREAFDIEAEGIVDAVMFNGRLTAIDDATGRPIRPCLVSVGATREQFGGLVLANVKPIACLRHLNALMSPHPYDLEPVTPVMDFDLTKYRLVEGMDVLAGLDSRIDLVQLTPTEFEHLVRQLFEAVGMECWVTQASRDDGVDAVAINPDAVVGGLCVVQAKKYRHVVEAEAVRALAGSMDDKRAMKGILVTTSWFGKTSWEFRARHGRMEFIEGAHLKQMLKEHLGLDVLIGLPKPPPKRPWLDQ